MSKRDLKAYVIGAVFALGMVAVATPAIGQAQSAAANLKKALQQVFVANDAANPVPVQAMGPSDVNVLNLVPVQVQGTTDVNVVNSSSLVPVQKIAFGTFPSGSRFSDDIELYTVPAGKQLVLETFTITSNLTGPDQHLMHVLFSATTEFLPFTINVQPVAEGFFSSTGANIFRSTQSLTAYAGPGTTITARGTRDGTDIAHLDSLGVGIAGRLVDAP